MTHAMISWNVSGSRSRSAMERSSGREEDLLYIRVYWGVGFGFGDARPVDRWSILPMYTHITNRRINPTEPTHLMASIICRA